MSLFSFLFFFSIISSTFPYTVTNSGREIRDLESNNEDDFKDEVSTWTINSLDPSAPAVYSQCNGIFLLGGYLIASNTATFSRTYTSLPSHLSVRIIVGFWFIDRWEATDYVNLKVSNVGYTFLDESVLAVDQGQNNWTPSICGSSSADLPSVYFKILLGHTGSTLQLDFTNHVGVSGSNRGSNGIRDVRISLYSSSRASPSFCTAGPPSSINSNYDCDCPDHKYMLVDDNTCHDCDGSCTRCFGSSNDQCVTCPAGTETSAGNAVCTTLTPSVPSCQSPKYLYSNTSCLSDCPSPFTEGPSTGTTAAQSCDFPCNSNQYHYPDTSCQSSCPTNPLVPIDEGGYKYCYSKCTSAQFIAPNNSCINTCQSPLQKITINGIKYCQSPCPSTAKPYYYPNNQTCQTACFENYELVPQDMYQSCVYKPPEDTTTVPLVGALAASSSSAKAAQVGLMVTSIVAVGNPSGILMGLFSKMFAYIKYLDINYSTELQTVLETWSADFISVNVGPNSPAESSLDLSAYRDIPEVFAKWDIDPSFIQNYWTNFTPIGIAFILLILFNFLEKYSEKKSNKKLNFISINFKFVAFNFLLTFIYNNYGGILFYSILDYQATQSASALTIMSILISLIFIIAGILTIRYHILFIKGYYHIKNNQSQPQGQLQEFTLQYKLIKVLFENFNDKSSFQFAFAFICLLRDSLFNIILITLYKYPLPQAILIILLGLSSWAYLIIKRPLKDTLDLLQQIFAETILFIVNLSVLIMATLQRRGTFDEDRRVRYGKIIITVNIIFNFSVFAFLGFKVLLTIIALTQKFIKKRSENQNNSLNLSAFPLKPTRTFDLENDDDNDVTKVLEISDLPQNTHSFEPENTTRFAVIVVGQENIQGEVTHIENNEPKIISQQPPHEAEENIIPTKDITVQPECSQPFKEDLEKALQDTFYKNQEETPQAEPQIPSLQNNLFHQVSSDGLSFSFREKSLDTIIQPEGNSIKEKSPQASIEDQTLDFQGSETNQDQIQSEKAEIKESLSGILNQNPPKEKSPTTSAENLTLDFERIMINQDQTQLEKVEICKPEPGIIQENIPKEKYPQASTENLTLGLERNQDQTKAEKTEIRTPLSGILRKTGQKPSLDKNSSKVTFEDALQRTESDKSTLFDISPIHGVLERGNSSSMRSESSSKILKYHYPTAVEEIEESRNEDLSQVIDKDDYWKRLIQSRAGIIKRVGSFSDKNLVKKREKIMKILSQGKFSNS